MGCGAAAGLAATYNIPIGGALFAMEVILGNFALEIFGPIVASSVIATLISRSLTGNVPLYAAPGYALVSGWEMLLYAGLGIVGAPGLGDLRDSGCGLGRQTLQAPCASCPRRSSRSSA